MLHLSNMHNGPSFYELGVNSNPVELVAVPRLLQEMAKIPIITLLGLWLLCNWAGAEYMKYKDPKQSIDTRVEDLISRMTLEEKIGQMLQVERKYASADDLKKYFIGKY